MYTFENDYSEGAAREILDALCNTSLEERRGYGMDSHCANAASLIKKEIKDAEIIAVTSDDVEAFASYLTYDRKNKERSVKRRLMAIKKFYLYLKTKEGVIEKLPTEGVVTHKFSLEDWEKGFDLAHTGADGATKVILVPEM